MWDMVYHVLYFGIIGSGISCGGDDKREGVKRGKEFENFFFYKFEQTIFYNKASNLKAFVINHFTLIIGYISSSD